MKLVYRENGIELALGEVLTNHEMTIDEALECLGMSTEDMDAIASREGWDDWDFEALCLI